MSPPNSFSCPVHQQEDLRLRWIQLEEPRNRSNRRLLSHLIRVLRGGDRENRRCLWLVYHRMPQLPEDQAVDVHTIPARRTRAQTRQATVQQAEGQNPPRPVVPQPGPSQTQERQARQAARQAARQFRSADSSDSSPSPSPSERAQRNVELINLIAQNLSVAEGADYRNRELIDLCTEALDLPPWQPAEPTDQVVPEPRPASTAESLLRTRALLQTARQQQETLQQRRQDDQPNSLPRNDIRHPANASVREAIARRVREVLSEHGSVDSVAIEFCASDDSSD